jgi:hypothetical protein
MRLLSGRGRVSWPLEDRPIMPSGTIRDGGIATIRKKIPNNWRESRGIIPRGII